LIDDVEEAHRKSVEMTNRQKFKVKIYEIKAQVQDREREKVNHEKSSFYRLLCKVFLS